MRERRDELNVGERIRELRKTRRVRQKTLAQVVGVSPGALTNFEKGRRRISLDWLQRISEALDTPMAYFLPEERAKRLALKLADGPSSGEMFR
jgi:transcriptional regulator with XRE-family HTH domain